METAWIVLFIAEIVRTSLNVNELLFCWIWLYYADMGFLRVDVAVLFPKRGELCRIAEIVCIIAE